MRAFAYENAHRAAAGTGLRVHDGLLAGPRWRNLVRKIEMITPPPLAVGSELRITMDVMGKQREAISEVWAYDPPRRFGQRNTASQVTGTFEYSLEPDGTGTRVRFTWNVRPHGVMWLLLPTLIRSSRYRYRDQLSS